MAEQKYFGKGIPVAAGFDLGSQAPLDSRTVAETIAERDSIESIKLYEGLKVYVIETKTTYTYVSKVNEDSTISYEWRADSSSTDSEALSKTITDLNKTVTDFKSDYDTKVAELETADETLQDNIDAANQALTDYKAEIEVFKTANTKYIDDADKALSDKIDVLNGDKDTVGSVAKAVNDLKTELEAADTALDTKITTNATNIQTVNDNLNTTIAQVNTNTTAIGVLNGDEDTVGSVANAIKELSDRLDLELTLLNNKVSYTEVLTVANEGDVTFNFATTLGENYAITDDATKLHINGLTYVETVNYTLDRANKQFTWTSTMANGGFDLDGEDVVVFEYTAAPKQDLTLAGLYSVSGTIFTPWNVLVNKNMITLDATEKVITGSNANLMTGTLIVSDEITEIGAEAFKDCSGLVKIKIPASVTTISDSAFSGCTSLQVVDIDDKPIVPSE